VPLLFAATLFVSASLLFMVQPMVGKMVLPLLGGSPAVWNACMVFFQLLLLFGYQYAHFVTGRYAPRKQWWLHILVLALPIAAFVLAVMFSTRHSPIAIAESLAPGGDSSPVLSVLALLTVAIAIPFFVVSTSAPLLQKWFGYTGHPSARDPYFLYSASNFGSLISLLGYPIFIEPNLSIVNQAWVFAGGFAVLAVLIFLCGRAAANPIGVPPASHLPPSRENGQGNSQSAVGGEPPPSLMRKLKWIALAFVPSSLMLGVTFHMTTDIASIPLLWVLPLALYLVTFIIAFGRVPDWFRVVIGNLAPVMMLLLVFVMISKVPVGMGLELILHLVTFFAAALMCHYELARDRPSPEHLTTFFLLMSVGGVLGGIFNSLVAPLVFTHKFEYELVLIIACLMVPNLSEDEAPKESPRMEPPLSISRYLVLFGLGVLPAIPLLAGGWYAVIALAILVGAVGTLLVAWVWSTMGATGKARFDELKGWLESHLTRAEFNALLDGAVPALIGTLYYYLRGLPGDAWYSTGQSMDGPEWFSSLTRSLVAKVQVSATTVVAIIAAAGPVMLCFFFVDRPVRFALCVAAILGYSKYRQTYSDGNNIIHSERSFFGILNVEEHEVSYVLGKRDKEGEFQPLRQSNGVPFGQAYRFRRLVHGTTLHGQQRRCMPGPDGVSGARFIKDDLNMILPGTSPWATVAAVGTIHEYDEEQEPLTYYHRTGPVGAMYNELRTRKNGADFNADVAMVGLGTGSAACYAFKNQHLTFYEIDPAVEHLVSDEAHDGKNAYFTFVPAARARGAKVTIRMGDARLKLKEDTDRQYALLLVDAFSSDSIPVHLLTTEAVQLYLDRMTEDGLLALHISNRWVRLEPVVSAIAKKLGLTARVWSDDNERGYEGKTASSWVVLARKPEHLGRLFTPLGDLPFALTPDEHENHRQRYHEEATTSGRISVSLFESELRWLLVAEFEELEYETGTNTTRQDDLNQARDRTSAWLGWAERKYASLCDPDGSQRLALFRESVTPFAYLEAYRGWFAARTEEADTPVKQRLRTILGLMRQYGPDRTLERVLHEEFRHGFRRLDTFAQVEAWTDDYADVMRVMSIPGLQKVRKFFGLPAPLER
jgi:hypothetical protein